jgi:hypothetical protein
MKKRVYIAESHHYVIKEWFRYKKSGVHLLSFDYHTDFQKALVRKFSNSGAAKHISYNEYLSTYISCYDIDAAIKDLRHDEHIDFALRSGIIEKAYVFSYDNFSDKERVKNVCEEGDHRENARIFSYCERYHPQAQPPPYDEIKESHMAKINTTDVVLGEVIQKFDRYGFDHNNYILDFDCDFIRNKEAMTHSNLNILERLIGGAKAITIARESSCVDEFSEGKLTSDEIQEWLIGLIKKSCCDVEIEEAPESI